MKTRNLTVTYKSETRGGKHQYHDIEYVFVPLLALKGKWMEEAGFNIGTKVSVECTEGVLKIIKKG